jgi:predicted AAA+ superfamily ATPase
MERFFNTAGPSDPEDHYCLSPLERIDLPEIIKLVEQRRYFILHAPRQTGKTTCLLTLMKYLNEGGKYKCLYVNVEAGQAESIFGDTTL